MCPTGIQFRSAGGGRKWSHATPGVRIVHDAKWCVSTIAPALIPYGS